MRRIRGPTLRKNQPVDGEKTGTRRAPVRFSHFRASRCAHDPSLSTRAGRTTRAAQGQMALLVGFTVPGHALMRAPRGAVVAGRDERVRRNRDREPRSRSRSWWPILHRSSSPGTSNRRLDIRAARSSRCRCSRCRTSLSVVDHVAALGCGVLWAAWAEASAVGVGAIDGAVVDRCRSCRCTWLSVFSGPHPGRSPAQSVSAQSTEPSWSLSIMSAQASGHGVLEASLRSIWSCSVGSIEARARSDAASRCTSRCRLQ